VRGISDAKEKCLMESIVTFNFGERVVRTAGTPDVPLFCAADACEVLGISDVSTAMERIDQDDIEILAKNGSQRVLYGGPNANAYITESGLYSLILVSRKPEAKPFKRWVTSEVLPAIRKTGQYVAKRMTQAELIAAQANMLVEIERSQVEHERRLAAMEADQLRRDEEAKAVGALPPAPVDVSERSYGQMSLALLNTFASKNNGQFQVAYRAFYQAVYERPETRIDLRARLENAKSARARGAKEPRLSDVIDATGKGPEIYAIARQLFVRAA
jgi:prophage antirepressor-like protein